jgi:hypothetical protein
LTSRAGGRHALPNGVPDRTIKITITEIASVERCGDIAQKLVPERVLYLSRCGHDSVELAIRESYHAAPVSSEAVLPASMMDLSASRLMLWRAKFAEVPASRLIFPSSSPFDLAGFASSSLSASSLPPVLLVLRLPRNRS